MRAVRLHSRGDLRLHEEPEPTPVEGEAMLRVTAVGLCGSDRHWYLEGGIGDAVLSRPLVLGHEFVGLVANGRRAGERVAADPAISCEQCDLCIEGNQHLCRNARFAGHGSTDGALRTSVAWPKRLLFPLPDLISDDDSPLLEPLGIAIHALDVGGARTGMTAGVYGCGPIGLLIVQLLALIGFRTVVATDPLAHRVEAARAMGATHAFQVGSMNMDSNATIDEVTEGVGVDIAFDAAGDESAVATAFQTVRPAGRVVLVGIPSEDRTTFVASTARRKGLMISMSRRMRPTDLPRAIHLAAAGRVKLGPLVTETYDLSDASTAFASLTERRGLKVLVHP